jgi:O-antigen ligase
LLLGLGPLVLFNLFSVGSVYFSGVGDIVNQILPDPSFTGRTSIWQFALDSLAARPVTGYGYAAFWGTPQVVYGLSQPGVWAAEAAHAHNAYLNLAVAIGIPGLLLVLAWVGVLPVVDFLRQAGKSQDRWLAHFFLRVWLFGLYSSCFESTLFTQASKIWFIFMIAVYGLRYLSVTRLVP